MSRAQGVQIGAVLATEVLLLSSVLRGDSWTAPEATRYLSANGRFVFRVTPDKKQPPRVGWCLGELCKIEEGTETALWRRYLVNNRAPVAAMVADSGVCVVTMDEWGHLGMLPLVLYDSQGGLIKVHNLESLFQGKVIFERTVSASEQFPLRGRRATMRSLRGGAGSALEKECPQCLGDDLFAV